MLLNKKAQSTRTMNTRRTTQVKGFMIVILLSYILKEFIAPKLRANVLVLRV